MVGLTPEGGLQLAGSRNASRFREGDILCLNQGGPNFHPKLKVTLTHDGETQLGVAPAEFGPDLTAFAEPGRTWNFDRDTLDPITARASSIARSSTRSTGSPAVQDSALFPWLCDLGRLMGEQTDEDL